MTGQAAAVADPEAREFLRKVRGGNVMDVGIIGAGRLGQAMARTALRAGRQVVLANSRGPESLAALVSALGEGASAGTVDEAAGAGIVVVAVPWPRVPGAVQGLAGMVGSSSMRRTTSTPATSTGRPRARFSPTSSLARAS
jgi:3-hydroxyisobutyrate dehydrogenase-like beta-hydroxyacid dehydrogenase